MYSFLYYIIVKFKLSLVKEAFYLFTKTKFTVPVPITNIWTKDINLIAQHMSKTKFS